MEKSVILEKPFTLRSKLQDYAQLTKMRLASLVVFSAGMAFMMAPGEVNWSKMVLLLVGGFLVTGASNGFNQILEKDLDKLMTRTFTRPLPDSRMGITEAFIVCTLLGAAGVFILTFYMNIMSGFLGLLALILYTFVYTPLKRKSPFAVFVGAVPGAIPPMLGWVAATGNLGVGAWILFSIQFMWQFPHFWAIAWVLDEDYKKAGFNLLPTGQRDKGAAFQALLYTFTLIPIGIMPYVLGMSGIISAVIVTLVTLYFLFRSWQLYRTCTIASAKSLMYGSFIYLPVVLIALVLDKI